MKTAELTGALLDYYVARSSPQFSDVTFETRDDCIACLTDIDGEKFVAAFIHDGNVLKTMRLRRKYQHAICYSPSIDWAQGGALMEKHSIGFQPISDAEWLAEEYITAHTGRGQTPLVAAMRAFVSSVFGDEVPDEVPEK